MKEDDASLLSKGSKRPVPKGKGRGATPSKRGRKSDNSSLQRLLMNRDDDDDDEEDATNRYNKPQTRVGIFSPTFILSK